MHIHRNSALCATSLLLTAALTAQGASTAPCFVTNFGTNLNLTDDSVAQGNALGFTFPGPAGNVTSIDISSNGFVWLGSNIDPACCDGDPVLFLSGTARIAPLWMDLDPTTLGAVWFNTFPASGSTPASAVVTWDNVPEIGTPTGMTFQLQMFADGSFVMAYDPSVSNVNHIALMGVTEGTAATATPIDFQTTSTTNPYISGTNPTVYELQSFGFDVAGRSFSFVPLGTGGYLVTDRPQCAFANSYQYGNGCPAPGAAYELFDTATPIDLSNTSIDFVPSGNGGYVTVPGAGFFTGYTNSVAFFDDDVQTLSLPFAFPFAGQSFTSLDVSSNGFVWVGPSNLDPRCCNGDPTLFLADGPSIAPLWMDLYPPGGGSIYLDTTATEAHITWLNVPEYFNGAPQTAQLTVRSDGSMTFAYQTVLNAQHDCLVGVSGGHVTATVSPVDFSSGVVIVPSSGNPLRLAAAAGSLPTLGSNFGMEIDQVTTGSLIALAMVGTQQFVNGVDLTFLGMPGCALYTSLDVIATVPLSGPPATVALPVPNTPSLIGVSVFAQAATLTPNANPFGFVSSNGLAITVGL